ncbi:Uu.00g017680.m01.CDS01 [Anthostomella pinea]|uniref:Uu.00g017680.m01.CDS01 n=1 Tax=Anthostomella pinea TaxID=933095 RepID=A0AAI8VZL2_9PEZI|nr:Uu.00g017680.m01.CDS01 [Anthostomella pinea]
MYTYLNFLYYYPSLPSAERRHCNNWTPSIDGTQAYTTILISAHRRHHDDQNIYDDPGFFSKYLGLKKTLPAGQAGVRDLSKLEDDLPPMSNLRGLDIGCGDGWFSRWAIQTAGAANMHCIDISQSMLGRARELSFAEADIINNCMSFERVDLNHPPSTFAVAGQEFDFAFSALAIHYLTDWPALARAVHQSINPNGWFYFSIEHPMATAARKGELVRDADGNKAWPINGYSDEGDRVRTWLSEGVVKQHRTLASYMNGLLDAGFDIVDFLEWGRADAGHLRDEKWWSTEEQLPCYLMIGARKRKQIN